MIAEVMNRDVQGEAPQSAITTEIKGKENIQPKVNTRTNNPSQRRLEGEFSGSQLISEISNVALRVTRRHLLQPLQQYTVYAVHKHENMAKI